jgi:PKD repeat protein
LTALWLSVLIPLSWVGVNAARGQGGMDVPTQSRSTAAELFAVAVVPVPAYGRSPLTVAVNARVSGLRDTGAINYLWNFGDGDAMVGPPQVVTHTYRQPGSYVVTAIVTTADGLSASGSAGVIVTP